MAGFIPQHPTAMPSAFAKAQRTTKYMGHCSNNQASGPCFFTLALLSSLPIYTALVIKKETVGTQGSAEAPGAKDSRCYNSLSPVITSLPNWPMSLHWQAASKPLVTRDPGEAALYYPGVSTPKALPLPFSYWVPPGVMVKASGMQLPRQVFRHDTGQA